MASVVLATYWSEHGLPADAIKGGLVMSPRRHLDRITAPVVVSYGTLETPDVIRQAKEFVAALESAGKPVGPVVGSSFFTRTCGRRSGTLTDRMAVPR